MEYKLIEKKELEKFNDEFKNNLLNKINEANDLKELQLLKSEVKLTHEELKDIKRKLAFLKDKVVGQFEKETFLLLEDKIKNLKSITREESKIEKIQICTKCGSTDFHYILKEVK